VGLFLILNYTRLGMRIRAGTLDLETVSVLGVNVRMLRSSISDSASSWQVSPACSAAGSSACSRPWATGADHAELHRHHRRRPRQPAGHACLAAC
jgi:hypothetical protein